MTWRNSLLPGSFKGASFQIEGHNHNGGRRGQLHEYPQRDTPYFEDMGRKAREFTIDAFIVGENYQIQRDALIAACESQGGGSLVHPYLGTKQVVCTSFTVSERIEEGRMCRVSMTMVEAGTNLFPAGAQDLGFRVAGLAGLAEAATIADFVQSYSANGLPGFVFESVESVAGDLISIVTGLSGADEFVAAVSGYARDIQALSREPADLASSTFDLIKTLRAAIQPSQRDPATASAASQAMQAIAGFSVAGTTAGIKQTTATRIAQVGNLDAYEALVRRAALVNEAMAVPSLKPDSYQAATAYARDYVGRVDDELLAGASNETSYLPLTDLAAAVSASMNTKAGTLPQLIDLTLPETKPSLLVAYEQYADAKRSDDVLLRNKVRNPSFVPAGVPLEVLAS